MKKKYPTWNRIDSKTVVSEEQMDGVPDFYIALDITKRWRVKWRTSAHWSGPYATAAMAMRAVENNVARQPIVNFVGD